MNDFIMTIAGTTPLGTSAGLYFIACFTFLIFLCLYGNAKRKASQKSPVRFSISYLLSDNSKRIIGTFLLMALAIRFTPELLSMEPTPWTAVIVGALAALDILAKMLKGITGTLKK